MAAIGTRKLQLNVDATEVTPEVSNVRVTSGESESDFVSFADAAAGGGRVYKLAITMTQNAATGTLWDQVWSHAGEEVDVIVRPYGNATPTATEPHFEGTCVVAEPDGDLLGGEADKSATNRFTTEVEWEFTAKPTKVTA